MPFGTGAKPQVTSRSSRYNRHRKMPMTEGALLRSLVRLTSHAGFWSSDGRSDPFVDCNRALRHWVIARLISQGTRTPHGSRVFAILASVIDTCRLRGLSPWTYLASVIAERRQGQPAPELPAAA
jgi:transposase